MYEHACTFNEMKIFFVIRVSPSARSRDQLAQILASASGMAEQEVELTVQVMISGRIPITNE